MIHTLQKYHQKCYGFQLVKDILNVLIEFYTIFPPDLRKLGEHFVMFLVSGVMPNLEKLRVFTNF